MATKKASIFKTPTIGGVISGIGSVYTGITSFRSAFDYAEDIRFQGNIILQESIRTANIIDIEGKKFAAGQALQYIGSGVQIAGSALVTIAQTKKYAATESAATRAKGAATLDLAERTAKRKEAEGRSDLVSGIIGGVASIFL
jgi:hypothetical protein